MTNESPLSLPHRTAASIVEAMRTHPATAAAFPEFQAFAAAMPEVGIELDDHSNALILTHAGEADALSIVLPNTGTVLSAQARNALMWLAGSLITVAASTPSTDRTASAATVAVWMAQAQELLRTIHPACQVQVNFPPARAGDHLYLYVSVLAGTQDTALTFFIERSLMTPAVLALLTAALAASAF